MQIPVPPELKSTDADSGKLQLLLLFYIKHWLNINIFFFFIEANNNNSSGSTPMPSPSRDDTIVDDTL